VELRLNEVHASIRARLSSADEPLCAYVYDLEALRRHASRLMATLPPEFELFYAIKANSELPVLQTLAPLVDGFEISSGGELTWVRDHFPAIPLAFSGPGKLDAELAAALAQNVEVLHVESLHELQRLDSIAGVLGKTADILLRINLPLEGLAETTLMMGGKPTPFGIPVDQLPVCLDWLRQHPRLRLRGFHFHLMSHQLDAAAHMVMLQAILAQVRAWREEYGLTIAQVNVGGGIGIHYRAPERQFDWALFSGGLAALKRDCGLPGVIVRFELGRYLTAACGYYAMQVIDIKQSYGKTFVIARGGTHHFRTPYAQGHSHPFQVLPVEDWPYGWPRPEISGQPVSVVGQLCTPKDVLAFEATVGRVRCGDVLVFPYAGAYAWHISHHDFLRHPHPAQWYLPAEVHAHAEIEPA
jgi:diaminopimelate decarboxylase